MTWRHRIGVAIGYILFMPPAFLMHLFWTLYGGLLAYPIAKFAGIPKTVKCPFVLIVGPLWVSSTFMGWWPYYGCEPEDAGYEHSLPAKTLRLDISWRMFDVIRWQENLGGRETFPVDEHTEIKVRLPLKKEWGIF